MSERVPDRLVIPLDELAPLAEAVEGIDPSTGPGALARMFHAITQAKFAAPEWEEQS